MHQLMDNISDIVYQDPDIIFNKIEILQVAISLAIQNYATWSSALNFSFMVLIRDLSEQCCEYRSI